MRLDPLLILGVKYKLHGLRDKDNEPAITYWQEVERVDLYGSVW